MKYDKNEIMKTAEYIIKILNTQPLKVMSWGAKSLEYTVYNDMMALKFKVNGFLHKGHVYVCYNEGTDLFEVFTVKGNGTVVKHVDDVYFSELVDTIDSIVEKDCTDEEYREQVRKKYGLN